MKWAKNPPVYHPVLPAAEEIMATNFHLAPHTGSTSQHLNRVAGAREQMASGNE